MGQSPRLLVLGIDHLIVAEFERRFTGYIRVGGLKVAVNSLEHLLVERTEAAR